METYLECTSTYLYYLGAIRADVVVPTVCDDYLIFVGLSKRGSPDPDTAQSIVRCLLACSIKIRALRDRTKLTSATTSCV